LRRFFAELKQIEDHRVEGRARSVFGRGIREYLRRDFHPRQNDNYELARAYLEQAGYEPAPAAA
jgi:predicted metal-dependent hydrolase